MLRFASSATMRLPLLLGLLIITSLLAQGIEFATTVEAEQALTDVAREVFASDHFGDGDGPPTPEVEGGGVQIATKHTFGQLLAVGDERAATTSVLEWEDLGDMAPGEAVINSLAPAGDDWIVAATLGTGPHISTYRISTGEFSGPLLVPGGAAEARLVRPGADGRVYVGTLRAFGQGNLASLDPSTNTLVNHGSISDEYTHGLTVGLDGKVYVSTCCNGELSIYDPLHDSWEYKGRLLSNYRRLTGLTTTPDGMIYGVTSRIWISPYGDASLFRYDPNTGTAQLLENIWDGSHEAWNIVYNPTDGLLYGSVDYNMTARLWSYDPEDPNAEVVTVGELADPNERVYQNSVFVSQSGQVYVMTEGGSSGNTMYVYDPQQSEDGLVSLGPDGSARWPGVFGPDGRLYTSSSNTTHLSRSTSITECNKINPNLRPIILVTGWGGSAAELKFDDQLNRFPEHLAPHGYVEGCNLFYAAGTTPDKTIEENGATIAEEICAAAWDASIAGVKLPTDGRMHFDIIAHSYGGLRSRGMLEGDPYREGLGLDCSSTQSGIVMVDNLVTLGTPHGGGVPDLPFSVWIGLGGLLRREWPAIVELNPAERLWSNLNSQQPSGTEYHLVSGDARLQTAYLPSVLTLLYYKWPIAQVSPNDFAVHQWSAHALALNFWKYPDTSYPITLDLHGQVPRWVDPLGVTFSYVNPSWTFDNVVCHLLGLTPCPPISERAPETTLNLSAEPFVASNMVAEVSQPIQTAGMPLQDIDAGVLEGSQSTSGAFTLNGAGEAQVAVYWSEGALSLTVTDPLGNTWTESNVGTNPDIDYLELDTGFGLMASYLLSDTVSGEWTYGLTATNLAQPAGYRLIAVPPLPVAVTGSAPQWVSFGDPVVLTATVAYSNTIPVVGGSATARILAPDGVTTTVQLLDDGGAYDDVAGDGIFGGTFTQTTTPGNHGVLFTATGVYDSIPFTRTATASVSVASNKAALAGAYADNANDTDADGFFESLQVDVDLTVSQPSTFTVSAELYAGDTFVAHGAATGALLTGTQTLSLPFDGHSIRLSGEDGPYAVRNVLLFEKLDTEITLIETVDDAHTTAAYDHTQFDTLVAPASLDLSAPVTGTAGFEHALTATVGPLTATHPITYMWEATGQLPVTTTGGLNDTVLFTWNVTGTQRITLTVENLMGRRTVTQTVDVVPGGDLFYMSLDAAETLNGIDVAPADIVVFDPVSGQWASHFDGAAAGVGSADVDAFLFYQGDQIVMSFADPVNVPGIGVVDDSDLVLYAPDTGAFVLAFDGSDVGLESDAEDVDAVTIVGGRLAVSTRGAFDVPGLIGGGEDFIQLSNPSFGQNTSGDWVLYFDGSDIGLGGDPNRNLDGAWFSQPSQSTGRLFLSSAGAFELQGLSIAPNDIIVCQVVLFGDTTWCSGAGSGIYWSGSAAGLGANLDALQLVFEGIAQDVALPELDWIAAVANSNR